MYPSISPLCASEQVHALVVKVLTQRSATLQVPQLGQASLTHNTHSSSSTWQALPNRSSGEEVAKMTRSRSTAWVLAISRAAMLDLTPSCTSVSPWPNTCLCFTVWTSLCGFHHCVSKTWSGCLIGNSCTAHRSNTPPFIALNTLHHLRLIPVRVLIHSSLVSTSVARSSLLSTVLGAQLPTPSIRIEFSWAGTALHCTWLLLLSVLGCVGEALGWEEEPAVGQSLCISELATLRAPPLGQLRTLLPCLKNEACISKQLAGLRFL